MNTADCNQTICSFSKIGMNLAHKLFVIGYTHMANNFLTVIPIDTWIKKYTVSILNGSSQINKEK